MILKYYYFLRSGSVLVRDSNHSDWIYIIKSVFTSLSSVTVQCMYSLSQPLNLISSSIIPFSSTIICSVKPAVFDFSFLQGSCQVIKKLREVKCCLTQHNDRVVGFENGILS